MKFKSSFAATAAISALFTPGPVARAQASSQAQRPAHAHVAPLSTERAKPQPIEGTWVGTLNAGDVVLHMVLHLSKNDDGSQKAALDSLDQGVYGIEASSVSRDRNTVRFSVLSVSASFEGTLSLDRATIAGNWSQGGATLPLLFRRQPRADTADKPSDPVASSEGVWQGALETKGLRFRLQLRVSHDTQGQLVAAVDSIDQGINGVPATKVSQTGSELHFELPSVRATFDGTLDDAANKIAGHWKQGADWEALDFKRSDVILELRRPQTPVKPYPYRDEEVTFVNPRAGVTLAGTLTLPRGTGPFAAAILLSGSGPMDRDESDYGHRPFLVLSDYLTRSGLAVLRYDKRGIGKSGGDYDAATTKDFESDAQAALKFLRTRKDIDPRRIGLIGHSEGGVIAPMMAANSADIAWVVLLGAPATKGEDTLLLQSELMARAAGMTDTQVAKSLELDRQAYALVRKENDPTALRRQLAQLAKSSTTGAGALPSALQREILWTSSPWFRYFLDYDPGPALRLTKCPVLALTGGDDLQVPPKENLPLIQKDLQSAGNQDFDVRELPGLNHMFQHGLTGLPMESRAIEETFAPVALEDIKVWISKHTTLAAGKTLGETPGNALVKEKGS